jgi:uncharacterized protein (TIGR03067 family)
MRRVLLLVPVLVLAGASVRGGDATKDQERLQGTWAVKSMRVGGKEVDPPVKETKLTIEGNNWTQTGGKRTERGTYKLDPSKMPKHIDITKKGDKGSPVLRGIYSLKGDTLKICVPNKGPEGPRPASFDDKDAYEVTLTRVKP